MHDVIRLLRAHRSIRRFQQRPVPPELVEELVRAGQAASTSSFIQACTLIQVNDPADRERLAEYAGGQSCVATAPLFLVFCADMQRHRLACDMNGVEMLSGYTEQFITATVDCALLAQNLMVAAEAVGLGGVYIGGIRNRIAAVAELLALPELVYPVFGMCLGWPDQDPEIKPRLPLEVVLKQDRYDDSGDRGRIAGYDRVVEQYYANRLGSDKRTTWSRQMAGMLEKEARPHMLPFLRERGFLLK
ncbi:MAG TPA: oxygen-insensitive NADPH nitroreductase [Sedimenticola thiotaurini]|uniref:Oxygen-insensitive NADPH nitroreductase n=1 Tax=Sedimenticola thiotaurini TaxID=1543721 RepID=A0A831W866_9GAMM|nr:oxygen-insensitive NADPH nitroreductase [Sedimenticola thiotaurini]